MIKKLLLCLAMVAFVGTANAQNAIRLGSGFAKNSSKQVQKAASLKLPDFGLSVVNNVSGRPMQLSSTANGAKKLAPMQRADATSYVLWGYPMNSQGSGYVWGWNAFSQVFDDASMAGLTDYNVAVYVPSTYAKAVIDSVYSVFSSGTYSNFKIWVSAYETDGQYIILPSTPEEADYCENIGDHQVDAPSGMVAQEGYELSTPYTVPDNGCFIGISFTTTVELPLFTWDVESSSGAFFMQMPYQGEMLWNNMASYGIFGNLPIMALMDISNCSQNDVSIQTIPETAVLMNTSYDFSPVVYNNAIATDVTSVSYVLTVDGEAQEEQTLNFSSSLPGGSGGYISVPYTFTTEGIHPVSIEITKVNGEANASTSASTAFDVLALETSATRTPVVEEFTGTWCGWCPRGHVGLDLLKESYGDGIITLAAHASSSSTEIDPMECATYLDVVYGFAQSFPSALYDRCLLGDAYQGIDGNQYAFGATQYVDILNSSFPSEATVTLTADWGDTDKNVINANVGLTFGCTRISLGSANPYAVAFVLSEDDMTGDGQQWLQYNYYSGDTSYGNDDNMLSWVTAGKYVQMDYDHVVVQGWDALLGIDESVPSTVFKGENLTYNATLDISANTLIQNKEKLHLTALLINRNNYSIVNAAQVSLGDGGSSAIEGVTGDANGASEVARYNVNGVRLDKAQKGLNIVKYSDGTTKKVIVK